MTISSHRTITIGRSSHSGYGTMPAGPSWRWPTAEPSSNLDYSIDITALLTDVADSIFTVSAAASPSGTGELALTDLSVNGNTITLEMHGGVAGRNYLVALTVTTAAGRIFELLVGLGVNRLLASYPLPPAPVAGFGVPITWSSGGTMFGSGLIIATSLVSTGTTQLTALPIPAVTNVFSTVAAGTGTILSTAAIIAIYRVTNAGGNDLLVYPPVGANFSGYSANAPIALSPNQTADFMTQNAASLWFVS